MHNRPQRPSFGFGNGNKNTVPLTAEQKQRLQKLLEAHGGRYVGKDIENNLNWFTMAKQKGVCKVCAAKGHVARTCPISERYHERYKGKYKGKVNGQLNAMLEEVQDSEMQNDLNYLFSLMESDEKLNAVNENEPPLDLMMYTCRLNDIFGTVLCDYGATHNYVSWKYAKEARLPIQPATGSVGLMNGNTMTKYGTVQFPLRISNWHGTVECSQS